MRDAHDIEIDETEGKDRNELRAMLFQAWSDQLAAEKEVQECVAGLKHALDWRREAVEAAESLKAQVAELSKWRDIAREEGEEIRKLERKLAQAESEAYKREQEADTERTLRCLYQRRARVLRDALIKAKGNGIAWVPSADSEDDHLYIDGEYVGRIVHLLDGRFDWYVTNRKSTYHLVFGHSGCRGVVDTRKDAMRLAEEKLREFEPDAA